MSHLDTALARLRAGLCVLPARLNPKMPALAKWKAFQECLPTEDQVRKWFRDDKPMCIVTGAASGQLEMIDFDAGGEAFDAWTELVRVEMPGLVERLVIERSLSGGRHVVYRCQAGISGSVKLAQRQIITPNGEPITLYGKTYVPCRRADGRFEVILALIETRGEGGLFLCNPTPGYEPIQGDLAAVPVVAEVERELLLRAAWSLDELPRTVVPELIAGEAAGRPGDDFDERGDIREVLRAHGWSLARAGENEYWRRPGKPDGWSATLKGRVFYVFSANAAPFEPNRGYSPFGVYARLEHAGDFAAAASALRGQGFGQPVHEGTDVNLSAITAKPKPQSELVARRACEVTREDLAWLWPGRIPLGKLTLLAGDPGLGKSLVTLDIAARVSRGAPWPDNPLIAQPVGEVVLFNAEDDANDTITPRLDLAGADDGKIILVEGVQLIDPSKDKRTKLYFSLEHHLPQLERALQGWSGVRLIVIDPISAYCGQTDSHNNAEVRALLAPLADLAGRTKAAVLAVTHLSKSGGPKAIYRAMGSLAFAAASRAVWAIVKDAEDPKRRLFLPTKLNLAVDPAGLAYRIVDGRVEWEPEPVNIHADDAFRAELDGPSKADRSTQRDEAEEWLREHLAGGPVPTNEVLDVGKEAGFSERTLRRAFKELGGRSRKDKEGGCWRWSLPDQDGHEDGQAPLP